MSQETAKSILGPMRFGSPMYCSTTGIYNLIITFINNSLNDI
jgi:hypothetical protein